MQMPMLTNSSGQPSSSLTFAWISFIFCLVMITLGVIGDLTLGSFSAHFKMIDAGIILSLLGPAFSLYGYRAFTDTKYAMTAPRPVDPFMNNYSQTPPNNYSQTPPNNSNL